MVPTQSVVADVIVPRVMVRDDDPGVVAVLPADDLATGKRVDPTEAGAVSQGAVNPAGIQRCVISDGQVRPNSARRAGEAAGIKVFSTNKWPTAERIFVFC